MSSKLAKVLLICALAVVLPLFIAGTVIAVYYSMNAVTTFEIYTDSQNIEAPTITSGATVEYDAESGTYRVINGHSKDTSVEYSAEGFNFDYWFWCYAVFSVNCRRSYDGSDRRKRVR